MVGSQRRQAGNEGIGHDGAPCPRSAFMAPRAAVSSASVVQSHTFFEGVRCAWFICRPEQSGGEVHGPHFPDTGGNVIYVSGPTRAVRTIRFSRPSGRAGQDWCDLPCPEPGLDITLPQFRRTPEDMSAIEHPSALRPKLAVPLLFTGTIFLSAALLFFVQPLFARLVLPVLGGAPAVWTTAMPTEHSGGEPARCEHRQ